MNGLSGSAAFARQQLQSMENCFNDAQGELEFTVEVLSDMVARKRLRASKHEISRSTIVARMKTDRNGGLTIGYGYHREYGEGDSGRREGQARIYKADNFGKEKECGLALQSHIEE